MTGDPLTIAIMLSVAILCLFIAVWRRFGAGDGVETRMAEYGQLDVPLEGDTPPQQQLPLTERLGALIRRLSFAEGLADTLRQSDVPLTVTEYVLLTLGGAVGGLLLGTTRAGLMVGLALAAIGVAAPYMYMQSKASARRRACANQLPDVLTMLVGMLRSGYGLNQSLSTVAEQAPQPSRGEFARVMQSVELGIALTEAMRDMGERIQSDDVDLFVTTIVIQSELGGNLSNTLEVIAETIRERIRLQQEIRSQTSQQQLSGYILSALPLALGLIISLMSPGYMEPLFQPGWPRLMVGGTAVMMVMGFLIMKRILVLEV